MASSMAGDGLGPGPVRTEPPEHVLTRHDFPQDFLFGAATSAYQIEGAYNEGRRGLANWDTWSLLKPDKVSGGGNGCVAIDHYNLFREDVKKMKKLGIDIYRFSIAWSRILPGGKLSSGINREGVRFYNDLIDLLLEQGIEPIVTIFHFDVPKCLDDEYGGFLDPKIVQDYAAYAEVCFFEFGDRVKLWTTVNEAHTFAVNGYVNGSFPPGHGSPPGDLGQSIVTHRNVREIDQTVYGGNAAIDPFKVGHHIILAHATAVGIYRTKYQAVQGGKIGIVNVITWYIPYSDKPEDVAAAKRAVEFALGWFTQPLVTGEYPQTMQDRVKGLPTFSTEEKTLVQGSFDYLGLNYYTTYYAAYKAKLPSDPTNYYTDQEVKFYTERDGIPIGPQAGSEWLYIYPKGIYDVLTYAKKQYNDPIIYITENGVDEKNDRKKPLAALLQDDYRIDCHKKTLYYVKLAMDKDRVKVKTYIVWSIFDNYEWAEGYTVRFGMYYVDYVNGLNRYPKNSVAWYMNFLNRKRLPTAQKPEEVEEEKKSKRKRN